MNSQFARLKTKSKEIIGVDITEESITVAALSAAKELVVQDSIIKNISASQTDDELSRIIEDIFTEKRLPKKNVWLNVELPPDTVSYTRISMPLMPEQEIPGAIKWHLKDRISLDIEKVQIQYEVSSEFQKEDGSKNINIMTVAVEKTVIDRFLNIFKKAGINLSGINVTPFSISNILTLDKELSKIKGPILICDIGARHSYIGMYVNDKLDFVRQIPLAQQSFLNAMTGTFMSDKGRVELSIDEAAKIIEEHGIPGEGDSILNGRISSTQIIAMIRPIIERLIGEILRSIDYCQKEFNYGKIEKILLTGQGSYVNRLDEFISKELAMQADRLVLPSGFKDSAAFGVAAGYSGKINFVPQEARVKEGEEIQKSAIRVAAIGILSVLFVMFISSSIRIAGLRSQLEMTQNQKVLLKDFKEMQDKINAVQAVVDSVNGKYLPADAILEELVSVTPGNIAFSNLSLNSKQKILTLTGKISARPDLVNSMLSNYTLDLEKTRFIYEANLTNAQREASESEDTSSFEIKCSLR